MASVVEMRMVLTGPREGNTENINGHSFVDGVHTIIGRDEQLEPFIRVMSSYGAYPEGSKAHNDAIAAYEELVVKSNGNSHVDKKKKQGERTKVPSNLQPDGEKTTKKKEFESTIHTEPESGTEEKPSDGIGHENAGDVQDQTPEYSTNTAVVNNKLLKAIYSLDPENDDHWVKAGKHVGKPKVSAIEEAYGDAGITRSDVEEVAPQFDREVSLDKLISDL